MNIVKIVPEPVRAVIRKNPSLAYNLGNLAERIDIFWDDLTHHREISSYNGVKTMLYPDEKKYLFKLAQNINHGSPILEIGCYAGGSLYFLGKGAEPGIHVYSVDPFASDMERQTKEYGRPDYFFYKPSKEEVEKTIKNRGLEHRVTLIEGFSQDVAKGWSNGKIGLLFIDGNHTQAGEDFYAWLPYLVPEALIAFHDSNYPKYGREEVERDIAMIIKKEHARVVNQVNSITTIALV